MQMQFYRGGELYYQGQPPPFSGRGSICLCPAHRIGSAKVNIPACSAGYMRWAGKVGPCGVAGQSRPIPRFHTACQSEGPMLYILSWVGCTIHTHWLTVCSIFLCDCEPMLGTKTLRRYRVNCLGKAHGAWKLIYKSKDR